MSKIVCDVCGSSYSETEAQCPICGTAKSEAAKPVVETTTEEQPKAGKYSQSNTKRTAAAASAARHSGAEKSKSDSPNNIAMIIVVAVLLLAIVVVGVCIAIRAFGGNEGTTAGSTGDTIGEVTQIPCTGIELVSADSLSFTSLTQTAQISVQALPTNTTDEVSFTYESSDSAVVLVDKTGKVTPVANGNATITVSYGDFTVEVAVSCELEEEVPTLELTKDDIKLSPTNGTSYDLINLIKNSAKFDEDKLVITSADESVVYIDGTKVVAVSNNSKGVTVTIKYGEQEVTCTVRVEDLTDSDYHLSRTDVTLTLGKEGYESFTLSLLDVDGNVVADVEWKLSNDFPKCCTYVVNEDGSITVTGVSTTATLENGTYVLVYTTYDSVKYQCKIVVNESTNE